MRTAATSLLLIVALVAFSGCETLKWPFGGSEFTYPIPGGTISASELCGEGVKRCDAGDTYGKLLSLTRNPVSPEIEPDLTPQRAAAQIIGKVIRPGDISGGEFLICAPRGSSNEPFDAGDIALKGSPGSSVSLNRTRSLNLNIGAAVSTDIDSLRATGVDFTLNQIEQFRASLETAYTRLNGSELNVTGRYYEYALKSTSRSPMVQGVAHTECADEIRSGFRLVNSVGMIVYDLNYSSNSSSTILADAQATLNGLGVDTSLNAMVNRTVRRQSGISTESGYQIIAFQHFGSDKLR